MFRGGLWGRHVSTLRRGRRSTALRRIWRLKRWRYVLWRRRLPWRASRRDYVVTTLSKACCRICLGRRGKGIHWSSLRCSSNRLVGSAGTSPATLGKEGRNGIANVTGACQFLKRELWKFVFRLRRLGWTARFSLHLLALFFFFWRQPRWNCGRLCRNLWRW